MTSAILQIAIIDLVFSINSIITAVGMADHVEVMIAAVMVAIAVMYFASEPVAGFIEAHPTTKMLVAFLFAADRCGPDRRRLPLPYPARLYLHRHRLHRGVEVVDVIAMRRRRRMKAAARAAAGRAKSPTIGQPLASPPKNPAPAEF